MGPELAKEIQNLPVWIEIQENVGEIKDYADKRISELTTEKGFIIVVTTKPRAWRISMYPVGFISGEATLPIGETMAKGFKRGDFYNSLLEASKSLNSLIVLKVNSVPIGAKTSNKNNDSDFWFYLIIGIVISSTLGLFYLTYKMLVPTNKISKLPTKEDSYMKNSYIPKTVRINKDKKILPPIKEDDKKKAEEIYNKYSQEERKRMVNKYSDSDYYSPLYSFDPFNFYMFMLLTDQISSVQSTPVLSNFAQSNIVKQETPTYVSEPSTPKRSSSNSSSNSSSSSRRSDDSYSSKSDDSGSSSSWSGFGSSSSSSSCDSSGSGGDW